MSLSSMKMSSMSMSKVIKCQVGGALDIGQYRYSSQKEYKVA